MNFDKPSSFEGMPPPSPVAIVTMVFCIGLEVGMFTMFFSLYTETIGIMSDTYISELPIIGGVFSALDPDANASHIVALLLAVFSVVTPLFIWAEIFRQKILDDPQEWFSHPQSQIIAGFTGFILILLISLEVVNLYTLVAQESMQSGFVQTQESGLMEYLAQNKGMAIGVSMVIAIINIFLALFSIRSLRNLKSSQE